MIPVNYHFRFCRLTRENT